MLRGVRAHRVVCETAPSVAEVVPWVRLPQPEQTGKSRLGGSPTDTQRWQSRTSSSTRTLKTLMSFFLNLARRAGERCKAFHPLLEAADVHCRTG